MHHRQKSLRACVTLMGHARARLGPEERTFSRHKNGGVTPLIGALPIPLIPVPRRLPEH